MRSYTRVRTSKEHGVPSKLACPHCGHDENVPMHVFAHWNSEYTVTCVACGKRFTLLAGCARRIEQCRDEGETA